MANGNGNGYGRSTNANWTSAGAVVVAMVALGWQFINPRDDIKQAKVDLVEQMRLGDSRLSDEIGDLRKQLAQRETLATHDEYAKRIDQDLSLLRADVKDMANPAIRVIRPEYAKDQAIIDSRMNNQLETLRKLQDQISGGYNIGKAFDTLQSDIRLIQQRLDAIKSVPVPSQIPQIPQLPQQPPPLSSAH